MRLWLILVLGLVFSCTSIRISPEQEKWNAYDTGEVAIFTNEQGEELKIEVTQILEREVKNNIYAGNLSSKREQIEVVGRLDAKEVRLLTLFKNSQGSSFINFNLALPDMLETNYVLNLDKNIDFTEYTLGSQSITDVVQVETSPNIEGDVQMNYVTEFYYSKSLGFLEFTLKDGEVWSLIQ